MQPTSIKVNTVSLLQESVADRRGVEIASVVRDLLGLAAQNDMPQITVFGSEDRRSLG